VISTQVLAEFCSTYLYKMTPAAAAQDIIAILQVLAPIRTISPDADILRRTVEAHVRYGIDFYDGMIVAAAERAGCTRIWSEDLNPKQKYFGIEVVNPFATA
jgi:predicted nucleic acid-binding protein